jgi:hypothetical protein
LIEGGRERVSHLESIGDVRLHKIRDHEATFHLVLFIYIMRTFLSLAAVLVAPVALAASSPKDFTAEDLLSAPRPQVPIPNHEGTHALSVVDNWNPKTDK